MARSFVQLSLDERRIIARMHEKKISQAEIARALRRDRPTIYKFAYSADGQAIKLWRHLPEHRARRRPRNARRKHGQRFSPDLNILRRPDIVADRKQFGHWECDLIQFRRRFGKANITSLVERVSRIAIFLRNNDRQSRPVMNGLIRVLEALPHLARRSIAFNRGTEFTDWPYLQAGIGTQTWFCDPQSPWQKGTVGNTSGRARKWLSREVDPLLVTEADLIAICNQLNARPRKCLRCWFPRGETGAAHFGTVQPSFIENHGGRGSDQSLDA